MNEPIETPEVKEETVTQENPTEVSTSSFDTPSDIPSETSEKADSEKIEIKDDVAPGEPSVPPHTEDLTVEGIEYDGVLVDINIPADLANFAQEKGFDAQEIATEIYSKEGLSEKTRNALNEAFGKWQVDTYLDGLKAKDSMTMQQFKENQESAAKAAETAWNETLELMGGDRWNDLDAFAAENLSEEEIAEFNEVMEKGSLRVQKLMIADIWRQYEAAGKPDAPVKLDLETGDNSKVADSSSAVTQAEYFEAFKNGEYRKNPAEWDQRRQAGLAKGI
jgi:anti-sigma28 factor (negative regulator of flagellin synthesis)